MLFRYPALVTGTPRGFRKPRLCVVVREIDLAITSLTGSDAPVAALLRTRDAVLGQLTQVELPVRHLEGRFYIPAEIDQHTLPAMLSNPFLKCPIRTDLLRLLRTKIPVHQMEREGVWPQGVGLYLDFGTPFPGIEDIVEKSRSVLLTEEGANQAALTDTLAESMYSHYLTVDGGLWRRVPEPAFVAELSSGSVRLEIDDILDVVPGRTAGRVVFPVTAYDAAVEASRMFRDIAVPCHATAQVFIPEAFSADFHDVNYARFARHLASGHHPDLGQSDLPRMFKLIDKITSARVDKIDFEHLEGLVEQAMAENDRLVAAGNPDAMVAMESRLREFHLDLWDGRVVDFAAVLPGGPRPS